MTEERKCSNCGKPIGRLRVEVGREQGARFRRWRGVTESVSSGNSRSHRGALMHESGPDASSASGPFFLLLLFVCSPYYGSV